MEAKMTKTRCSWTGEDPLMITYHDRDWGTPLHNDRRLFESIVLQGAQAGLSWRTILHRRRNYRKAFDNFDPGVISAYDSGKISELLSNKGIIRNRLKVESTVQNAASFLTVKKAFGSFDAYLWQFVGGEPIRNERQRLDDIPAKTEESIAMSKDLKKRGFKFVGPTICYALMQAVGMVNDHLVTCFRHHEL